MAAAFAVGALGPAIEVAKLIAKPIKRQFNYLCCFASNINCLKDEAKTLDDAIAGLEKEVEIAGDNLQEPVPQVKTWLANSNNLKVEIDGILNEAENAENGCMKLGARFSLSKKAKKTTARTKELRGENKFNIKFLQGAPTARREVQFKETYVFESRKGIEENIMTTLRGGDVNMMGICGMGGLGKTTMAQKIRNRVLIENIFQEVAFATFSRNVETSKIQVEIGGQLGLDLTGETWQGKVQKLHDRLCSTERSTLLILDDIWETLVLENFGIPRDSKRCTILFTSRDSGVSKGVRIFGMKVLSEEEAWSFFREKAGTCVDDRQINPIAEKVVKECGGLPLALEIVSAVLRDEDDVSIWEDALRQLSHSDPDIPALITKVYNHLKLSYDDLGSEQAKSMFLLFCLFPEDANIPLEYLTYFCMGLGIYKGIENLIEARNKTRALIKMLRSRSLLLEGDREDHVRMHDVVHDVCTFIAKEKGYIGKDGCTWISYSHIVAGSRCPNLHLLFFDCRYNSTRFKFSDRFLEGMRELYVFCFHDYSLQTLPLPTQSLGKLKILTLDSCYGLKSISGVGELVNLEILICRYCILIEELPSEMKGLNRLKLLELKECGNLQRIGRGIISSLVALEELKMLDSFDRWEAEEREERENASIKELEALPNLACLEIEIHDPSLVAENMHLFSSEKIVKFIIRTERDAYQPSGFSNEISSPLEREIQLVDWMGKQLLRDTECLCLSGDGANNVDWAKCQNLRWLDLFHCRSVKNVVTTSGGSDDAAVFPSLEHLRLLYLDNLQEICDGAISSGSFQNLKLLRVVGLGALTQFWKSSSVCENNYVPHFSNLSSIVIEKCHSLRNLGQLSMAGKDCLPQLELLRITNCSMMEQVFLWNDEEAIEMHVITKVFPKLQEVVLDSLPNLKTLYQGIEGIEFPLLKEMKIEYCPQMKSIVRSSSADIDDSLHLLIFQSQKVSFGSLEKLTITNYVASTSIFTLSMAQNLVSLRELRISKCDEMIKVIEDEQQQLRNILLFPELEELYLSDLPKLVSFCDSKCDVELPLLRKVEIFDCPNMENFSLGLVATPNMEAYNRPHDLCRSWNRRTFHSTA